MKIKNIKNKREKLIIAILCLILFIMAVPIGVNFLETETGPEEAEIIEDTASEEDTFIPTFANLSDIQTLDDIRSYLFYVDNTAYVIEEDFPLDKLAAMDLSLNLRGSVPRVLITHTHSSEYFADSIEGNVEDSIVGIGRYLAEILVEHHGVSVVHDVGIYDIIDGEVTRVGNYEAMEAGIRQILERHPQIELIIDLHRDAAPQGVKYVTEIEGRPTAKIMFFNGITRRNVDGEPVQLYDLFNPYILENLALSLQLFLTSNEHYPGLARRNYIKAYRYSLHLRPRSILVEVGANTNTVEEARNAMYPLAHIIMEVVGVGE